LIDRKESVSNILPFQLEVEILRRITNPRVPRFVEAFSLGDVHYIVQEFIAGPPLSYLVDNGCRFSEKEVKEILLQLLSILNELHCPSVKENAIVHRDIRLSNLLFRDGNIYLIDFGFARFLDPSQFVFCSDPLEIKSGEGGAPDGKLDRKIPGQRIQGIPGYETYRLLRRENKPRSDLFGVGVIAVDLFINLVEDESQFKLPWDKVLPLSESFVVFLKKLLSRKEGFETAVEALKYLESMPR
jgi:serine/threonine-protein kinase